MTETPVFTKAQIRAIEDIARSEALRVHRERKDASLAEHGAIPFEGALHFREHGGYVDATVDYRSVSEYLRGCNFKNGQRVAILVVPLGDK